MIIVMRQGAAEAEKQAVLARLAEAELDAHVSGTPEETVIWVMGQGDVRSVVYAMASMAGVDSVAPVTRPFKLTSLEFRGGERSIVEVNGVPIGGPELVVIGGPCSVEGEEQTIRTAHEVRRMGARLLRGGAFKPRTSPYSFRGLGVEGLEILAQAREETGLGIVTEVMTVEHLDDVVRYADMLQVGARNMHNYNLLEAVGRTDRPVLLKRGFASTVEEWLLAAEYIMAQGNPNVVLCERGIRSFDPYTRNIFDVTAIPLVQQISHLPVVGDPSQATGRASLVIPTSRAAVAAGADGLIVEVHPVPDHALSDGGQQVTPASFGELMNEVRAVATAVGRTVAPEAVVSG